MAFEVLDCKSPRVSANSSNVSYCRPHCSDDDNRSMAGLGRAIQIAAKNVLLCKIRFHLRTVAIRELRGAFKIPTCLRDRLCFRRSSVDDPTRFTSSRAVVAHFGLTPRRYQSGETDNPGRISKAGDRDVRATLYAAALSLPSPANLLSSCIACGPTTPNSVTDLWRPL